MLSWVPGVDSGLERPYEMNGVRRAAYGDGVASHVRQSGMDLNLQPTIDVGSHAAFNRGNDFDINRYVYHYTRWECLLDIAHKGIRLGSLANMNDPRESKDWYLSPVSWDTQHHIDMVEFWKVVAECKRRVKIASFSKDMRSNVSESSGIQNGYAHPRMWAQYAANHTGVCVVLERQSLDDAIRAQYPDRNGSWLTCGSIKYVDRQIDDPSMQMVEFLGPEDSIAEAVQRYFARYKNQIFFVKHADWRDEAEYRWVYYDAPESRDNQSDERGPLIRLKDEVAALILGADYSDAYLPVARSFASTFGLNGAVVRCAWNRLALRLDTFADRDGCYLPIPYAGAVIIKLVASRPTRKE